MCSFKPGFLLDFVFQLWRNIQDKIQTGKQRYEVISYSSFSLALKGPTESVQYIRIKEDETGYSYARVFQSCLDGNVEWAEVQDPYIRSKHQVHNFVRFCELVLKNCKRLRRIHLNTGFGDAHTEVRTCE